MEQFLLALRPEQTFRPHRLWRLPFLGLHDYALPDTIRTWFGDVDESFRRLKMDGSDLPFGNGGDTGDDADEITGQDGVRAANVESEPDHPGLVRDRARFFARPGTFGALAAIAPRAFVVVPAAFSAIPG